EQLAFSVATVHNSLEVMRLSVRALQEWRLQRVRKLLLVALASFVGVALAIFSFAKWREPTVQALPAISTSIITLPTATIIPAPDLPGPNNSPASPSSTPSVPQHVAEILAPLDSL